MNLEKVRLKERLKELTSFTGGGTRVKELAKITEVPPEYPYPKGRCINVIPGERGSRVCGNLLSRWNPYLVCEACKRETRGSLSKFDWSKLLRPPIGKRHQRKRHQRKRHQRVLLVGR